MEDLKPEPAPPPMPSGEEAVGGLPPATPAPLLTFPGITSPAVGLYPIPMPAPKPDPGYED